MERLNIRVIRLTITATALLFLAIAALTACSQDTPSPTGPTAASSMPTPASTSAPSPAPAASTAVPPTSVPPVEPAAPASQPQADPQPATPEADLTVEVLEYQEIAAGSVSVDVQVTNRGPDPAEAVVVSAEWTTSAPGLSVSGSLPATMPIGSLSPQGQQRTTLNFEIPSGAHGLTVSVQSETREINPEDNSGRMSLVVDYFSVKTAVQVSEITGYNEEGNGIIELEVSVSNLESFATAPYVVGVVCLSGEFPECPAPLALDSLEPGQDYTGSLTLLAPQGVSEIVVVASDNPDYNFEQAEQDPDRQAVVQLEVPERPATDLLVEADSQVLGYYSDGAAEVEVTASLTNVGYLRLTKTQPVPVRCSLPQNANGDPCSASARLNFQLPDGFGPAEKTFTMKLPMGKPVLEFGTPRYPIAQVEIDVPERILGVDREVWECYIDRPGRVQTLYFGSSRFPNYGGCGGWYSRTVTKWDDESPVKVWATGPREYVQTFEEVLDEIAPLLNLDFQWADSAHEADLKAFVGTSSEESGVICRDTRSCSQWDTDSSGAVTSGELWSAPWTDEELYDVGLPRSEIKWNILKETVQALTDMHHREHPGSVFNNHNALRSPNLSPTDRALLTLNSHHLVQPGMTMRDVEQVIIFEDQLLDPPEVVDEPSDLEIVRRAYVALQEAETARWSITGHWEGGRGCRNSDFGRADYEIGKFGREEPGLIHFRDENHLHHYFEIRNIGGWGFAEYWRRSGGSWERTDSGTVFEETKWRAGFSGPHIMLSSVFYFGEPDNFFINRTSDVLHLRATLDQFSGGTTDWYGRLQFVVTASLDPDTYQVEEYSLRLHFGGVDTDLCREYTERGDKGEYGIEILIPEQIQQNSDNLG